ncbi:hypothetical protein LJC49_10080 [Ruminococcaceae bacterium OttesenSCG-928-I18]|nr:hypothetical protein [Ruminococcaceae bacterium OttesenSCG-928-I18]
MSFDNGNGLTPGFSARINDSAFAEYIKRSRRISSIFMIVLAVVVFAGFAIYGLVSGNLVFALVMGSFLAILFLVVTFVTLAKSKGGGSWDGVIVDKQIKKRRQASGDSGNRRSYNEYILYVKDDKGKTHKQGSISTSTIFNYYQVGDRVRRHPGLHYFEKYDKTRDAEILCNACLKLNPVQTDTCPQCKCPVLK